MSDNSFWAMGKALIAVGITTVAFNACRASNFTTLHAEPQFFFRPYWGNPYLVDSWGAFMSIVVGIGIMIAAARRSRGIPKVAKEDRHLLFKPSGLTTAAASAALLAANFVYMVATNSLEIGLSLAPNNTFHIVMLLFGLGIAAASLGG